MPLEGTPHAFYWPIMLASILNNSEITLYIQYIQSEFFINQSY